MQLSQAQLDEFDNNGFIVLPQLFSKEEIAPLKTALVSLFDNPHFANIAEQNGGAVRTAMALHQRNPVFKRLTGHPRLLEPAQQIAGPTLYVQQVKVNVKAAFVGDLWQWHYDFATHHADDGVPQPHALNLHVFLDDVTEHNGPLYFVPGSHRYGPAPAHHDTTSTSYPLWVVEPARVAQLIDETGIISATGPAGTGLIFGDLMVHGSPNNMSPWDRAIFSLILNPVDNAQRRFARPDYKHHRDFSPVVALDDDCLLSC